MTEAKAPGADPRTSPGQTGPMRTVDQVRAYALTLPGAHLTYPFDATTGVVKVATRMFVLATDAGTTLSLKCDPYWARALRHDYPSITPGYHLNKQHWITVDLATGFLGDGPSALVDDLVADLVDQSYTLVVAGLTRRVRAGLGAGPGVVPPSREP
ncbi:MmcQ/YjbR family DNA-binding protein [Cellulomonas citrea]|uniref:MmcQ/YjbR family DNA-binding protein n=1 Tax=Cellulomonas citrea TaxID=1909423 RepID=UPI001F2B530E|nr:MmcQ/YjbR family DNA-binding protein [Cellulomonas citrea]